MRVIALISAGLGFGFPWVMMGIMAGYLGTTAEHLLIYLVFLTLRDVG